MNPITATSLDHTSTLVSTKGPTTKQNENREQMQYSPMSPQNVQLVTSDIKTETASETDDIEMQNHEMNITWKTEENNCS